MFDASQTTLMTSQDTSQADAWSVDHLAKLLFSYRVVAQICTCKRFSRNPDPRTWWSANTSFNRLTVWSEHKTNYYILYHQGHSTQRDGEAFGRPPSGAETCRRAGVCVTSISWGAEGHRTTSKRALFNNMTLMTLILSKSMQVCSRAKVTVHFKYHK